MRIDMQTTTDHADSITSYDLCYTIQGLPLPVTGVHTLPTAKDVILLYCAPKTTMCSLVPTILEPQSWHDPIKAGPFKAMYIRPQCSITLDMLSLWGGLPNWLREYIRTTLSVTEYILTECNYADSWEEREAYIIRVLDTLPIVEPNSVTTPALHVPPDNLSPMPYGLQLVSNRYLVLHDL